MDPLADRVAGGMGCMMATAGLLGGFGHAQLALQQHLDGGTGRFGTCAAQRHRVLSIQQARRDGSLSQQLRAGALAQVLGRGGLLRVGQHDTIDVGQGLGLHG